MQKFLWSSSKFQNAKQDIEKLWSRSLTRLKSKSDIHAIEEFNNLHV